MIREDPYRILICADKFQTGYDEPLLSTMYVDKILGGIKAVQTLSRLNRQAPNKDRVFVLDFKNNPDVIQAAFEDYYQTTILANENDPDKLHDLRGTLDQRQVYSWEQIDTFVEAWMNGADRGQLDPALDLCVEEYLKLDEDGQVEFKSSAKAFTRLYAFLSQVLPYGNPHWEKLSIFLNFLVNRLPAPVEEDLSRGVLEAVDMETYRMERRAARSISLAEEDAKMNSDKQNAQIEHDSAVMQLITAMVRCHTELYRTYTEDRDFQKWLNEQMFGITYQDKPQA